MICNKNHEFEMRFDSFTNGTRCFVCKNINQGNEYRHSYEHIKNYIEKHNYKLISTEYINNHSHLDLICDKNHEIKMTYHNFESGYRCGHCKYINGYKYKEYTLPSGEIVKCQGYENFALDILLKTYKEKDIIYFRIL